MGMWPRTSVTQTSSPGPPGSAAHPGKTQAQQKHKQRGAREAGRKDTGVPAGREFQRARRLAKAPQLPQGGKAALRVDRFSYLLPLGCARLCSHLPTIPKCCRSVSSGLLPGGRRLGFKSRLLSTGPVVRTLSLPPRASVPVPPLPGKPEWLRWVHAHK